MSHFRYRAIAPTGDFVASEVEVPSRQEVVRRCDHLGRAATTLTRGDAFRGHCGMTAFLRQLAVLVGAGLTLEAALQARGHDTGRAVAWLHQNLDASAGTRVPVALGAGSVWNRPPAGARISAVLASPRRMNGQPSERCAQRLVAALLVENGVPFSTTPKIVRDVVTGPHHAVAAEWVYRRVHNRCLFAMRGLRMEDARGAIALIAQRAAQFYEHTFGVGLDRLIGTVATVATIVVGALIVSITGARLSITELAT